MDLYVLNTSLQVTHIVDIYESLIWTDKYNETGDFEIYTKSTQQALNIFIKDYYLMLKGQTRLMVIEQIKSLFDPDKGSSLIISGRSVESILDRRIVWELTSITGNLQNGIKKLLDENAIVPTISDRTIPNLVFVASTDATITALTVDTQCTMTDLYDTIQKLCVAEDIGFRIDLINDQLEFRLYAGSDRSYNQITNPYVIFSKNYDNLISSEYVEAVTKYKTVTKVAGEGDGLARVMKVVGTGSGISRRELYTDARDLSQTTSGGKMSDADYQKLLEQRGLEKLAEVNIEKTFDSKIEPHVMFTYGVHYFLGDIVQVVADDGLEGRSRMVALTYSKRVDGEDTYPTFKVID
jgi:hypothetical protein